jgi:hypothetical protein
LKPIADRILRAAEGVVSRDIARPNVMLLDVPDPSVAVASDGHLLLVVIATNPHGIPVGAHVPEKALAYLRAGAPVTPEAGAPSFPAWDRAMPAPCSYIDGATADGARLVAFDPALMLRAGTALKILGCACQAAVWQIPTSPEDPLRVDAFADDLTAIVLIMPMRLGEQDTIKKIAGRV